MNFVSFNDYLNNNNIKLFDYQKRKLYYQLKTHQSFDKFIKCNNKKIIIKKSFNNDCEFNYINNMYKSI